MEKLILKIGILKAIISNHEFELIDTVTGELLVASFPLNSKRQLEFVLGRKYDIIVSPFEPDRGRIIISRKNYDLDYSHIES